MCSYTVHIGGGVEAIAFLAARIPLIATATDNEVSLWQLGENCGSFSANMVAVVLTQH